MLIFINAKNTQIYLAFSSLNRTFDLKIQGRRHLGNTKKIINFLCISLGLHYLCKSKRKD